MSPRKPTSGPKRGAKQSPPATKSHIGKSPAAPALHGVAAHPELRGRGPVAGAPNAGRPRKAVRLLYRDVMVREGIEAARAILLGEPDRSGNVPTFDQRLAWFREIAALGFNTKLELAKIEAAAGAANLQNGVQIIMQGAPAGNLQPIE